jgi:Tol biopolymer transport system component
VNPDGTGRTRATEAEGLLPRPLRAGPGLPLGEVSPDGRIVAASSPKVFRGNHDLYLHDISGGAARKLTDSELHDCCPTWSPDGKSLAFLRAKRGWRPDGLLDPGDVYVINADGSGERKLTGSGEASWPFWSPES